MIAQIYRRTTLSRLIVLSFAAFVGLNSTVIAADAFEWITPQGGEKWAAGSSHSLQWKAESKLPVRLEYSTDAGASWVEITTAVPTGGAFLWRIPNKPAAQCRLRVSDPQGKSRVAHSADFSITPSQQPSSYQWPSFQWRSVTSKVPFAPRDGAGALTFKNRMWLLGGWNPGDKQHFPRITNNEVWSSQNGADWDLVKPNTFLDSRFDATRDWEGRHTGGHVVFQDKLWLVGGDANQGHYQGDVWNSADGKSWTLVNPRQSVPWGPRVLQYTVVFQNKIWIMGGQTMPAFAAAPEAFYRDVWNTSDGVKWEQVTPREPYWSSRGMIGGGVVFKDRVWMLGGGTYDTPTTPARWYFNDVWSSADGVKWTEHATAPWPPRQYHSVAVFDDHLWVVGGHYNGDRNDVWYSADGENWYRLNGTPWQARHAASLFVHDGALWLTAGSAMTTDLWKLEKNAEAAEKADKGRKPTARVEIALSGLESRRAHIFDAESPGKSPRPLELSATDAMPAQVYAKTFGLNLIDPRGTNAYSELGVDPSGNVRFEKWIDGGQGLTLLIDNKTRPVLITIRWTND